MDRSMDSIGSCSLDVDAESTDISDTSGSLNFPTPISIKDITREFTNNIRERCSLQTVKNTTAYVDPNTGQVCIALTQPPTITNNNIDNSELTYKTIVTPQTPDNGSYEKKPSYLNLACCVNGYSNITTYDSKIRQDINKSREVSPIRPSSSSLQYCKKNNCLAPPILLTMPNVNPKSPQSHLTSPKTSSTNSGNRYIRGDNNNHTENGESQKECPKLSFIQQRVERLYGPGALAPGFYNPKKKESASINGSESTEGLVTTTTATATTELARKFQELSPSKDYNQFRKKFEFSGRSANLQSNPNPMGNENNQLEGNNNNVDLPCLRHLSQEFRAQLPTISPKRNYLQRISASVEQENNRQNLNGDDDAKLLINVQNRKSDERDEVDHQSVQVESKLHSPGTKKLVTKAENKMQKATTNGFSETGKDGHYFLQQLKREQARLLNMASEAEKCMETLKHNSEVSEDVMGFLRSASGKARLLVSQKMKQFEGLCHKNLKNSPDDDFPTTLDDLQGFWDMVYLQIDHVDSLFNEIEELKQNGWKKPKELKTSVNRTPRNAKTLLNKNRCTTKTATNSNSPSNSINSTPSAAAVKREVQRKKLQEIKRRNREAMAGSNTVLGEDSDVTIDVVVQTPKKHDGNRIKAELS